MKVCFLDLDENNELYLKKIDIESPSDYEKKASEIPDEDFKESILKALKNNENGGHDFGQIIEELYLEAKKLEKGDKKTESWFFRFR